VVFLVFVVSTQKKAEVGIPAELRIAAISPIRLIRGQGGCSSAFEEAAETNRSEKNCRTNPRKSGSSVPTPVPTLFQCQSFVIQEQYRILRRWDSTSITYSYAPAEKRARSTDQSPSMP
jgi:hypothetical protein